ncbi:hypothetical protein HAX54_046611 [Datura stramonium]|uniref:Secreted protein n=1 Tax=Datura stramonium TaxID=4076 RepID=A0ABS8WJB7_DATST|nr:hypothetical protein [Datura stramonium]
MNLTAYLIFLLRVEVGIRLWLLETPWRVALVNVAPLCRVAPTIVRRRSYYAAAASLGQGCLAHAIAPRRRLLRTRHSANYVSCHSWHCASMLLPRAAVCQPRATFNPFILQYHFFTFDQ